MVPASGIEISLWLKERLNKEDLRDFSSVHGQFGRLDRRHVMERLDFSNLDISWALLWLADFKLAHRSLTVSDHFDFHPSASSWSPPSIGCLKMNVDACVNSSTPAYGIGGILRNHKGEALFVFGRKICRPTSVLGAQLMAIKEGILQCKERRLSSVNIETDSLLAKQAVFGKEDYLDYEDVWIADIRVSMMNEEVGDMIHVEISVNSVAHEIVFLTSSSPTSFSWVDGESPIWSMKLVNVDVNSLE